MPHKLLLAALAALTAATLSACTPLVVGAAGAVIADEIVEDEKGGDGLF